jgi:hypothetical protein
LLALNPDATLGPARRGFVVQTGDVWRQRTKSVTLSAAQIDEKEEKKPVKADGRWVTINGNHVFIDANGNPQNAPYLEKQSNENFNKWFGKSKVVDENGKPLIVYHGTDQDFSEFEGEYQYFTDSPEDASRYSEIITPDSEHAPNVKPVYLSIQNQSILTHMPQSKILTR